MTEEPIPAAESFPCRLFSVLSLMKACSRQFSARCFLSGLLLLLSVSGPAEGSAPEIRPMSDAVFVPPPVVRYGMVAHPPLFFRDAQGTCQGFFVDLLRYVAEQEGWRLELVEAPGDRLVEMLQEGELDLLSMVPTPRLEKLFDFCSVHHHATWYTFFTRPGAPVLTYTDLNGRSVAIQRGFYAVVELRYVVEQLGLRCTILETDTMEEAFDLLARGAADVCAAEQLTGLPFVRRHDLRRSPIIFAPSRIYFGTTKGHNSALLHTLDVRLAELLDSPTSPYYRWQRRWFYDEELAFFPQWAVSAFCCAVVFLAFLAGGIVLLVRKERDLRRAGKRTARHLVFEKALSDCARLFLASGESDEVLSRMCRRLRELSEASWVAVYRNDRRSGEGYAALLVAETEPLLVTSRHAGFRKIFLRDVPREWVAALSEGHSWQEARATLQERRELFPENGCPASLLLFPLFEGKRWWGTMVLADAEERLWDEEARNVLDTVANMVGTYLSRRRAEERLLRLAATDGLTGLANRRAFFRTAGREIARAIRHENPLSLAIIDVDHFKEINDRYGHDTGDEVLRELAHLLSRGVRKEDFLGRLGGEEFGVLLPETTEESALAMAERLRRLVEKHSFAVDSESERRVLHLTVSVGVAPFLGKNDTARHFYRRADNVLYSAKGSGRNSVHLWTPPTEQPRSGREEDGAEPDSAKE